VQPARRRVGANAVTAHVALIDAAMAARDAGALPTLFADELEVVDHPTGSNVDRQGTLTSLRSVLRVPDLTYRHEPLATLGDSLGLFRLSVSASAVAGEKFDVGAYDIEKIAVVEVDAQGRARRAEDFAPDRLGDAVVRLYERYAELLPDGPERARAAATVRSVVALLGPFDLDRWATALAPSIEYFDSRTVGVDHVRGVEAVLRGARALSALSADLTFRVEDILELRPDALLGGVTNFGTDRASGGPFERNLCVLWIFGADGLVSRWDQFDADREAEALARFDELTGEIEAMVLPPARPVRRVRANAATANAARRDAAFAARDIDALGALLPDGIAGVHHPTGAPYDRAQTLALVLGLLQARDLTRRLEPLATLGDSLALGRMFVSGSGTNMEQFDIGAYDIEEIQLLEVDGRGDLLRFELFAADRLGAAVVRLYERYSEFLPDGPARDRAAATARSVAALLGPFDPDRYAAAYAPAIEAVDHRTLGFPPTFGAEAYLHRLRTLLETSDDTTMRTDDILGLRSDALLLRWTNSGTDRASGGAYERPFFVLWVFDSDGLATRNETFDADSDAEALARFDQLTAAIEATTTLPPARPVRRVRANAATAALARFDAAFVARDADALSHLVADEVVDHTTGVTFDRQGAVVSFGVLLRAQDPMCQHVPLATLGDSLALCRQSLSASRIVVDEIDVGAYERERLFLIAIDAQGRRRRDELFAADPKLTPPFVERRNRMVLAG
jgi:hypothetical protein